VSLPRTLPAHRPMLNAYAERFALSTKAECLSKVVPLGERHLLVCAGPTSVIYARRGAGSRQE